jgi:hypothetical protein
MDWIMLVLTIVGALATGVIAVYAMKAHRLTVALRQKDTEYQKDMSDLFQAIVLSNMLSGPNEVSSSPL